MSSGLRWTMLALALVVGSAGTSRAQVFRPRAKGPIPARKAEPAKADPKKPDAKVEAQADSKKPTPAVASRRVTTKPPKSRVASDSRPDDLTPDTTPKKPRKKPAAKHRKGGDDEVQVTDDADDDVKISDD